MNDRNYSFYLPDVTYEPMLDPENDMARLIYEHFGTEAEMCFKAILSNCWKKNLSVFEKGFLDVCWDALSPIYEIREMLCCDVPDIDGIENSLDEAEELIGQIEAYGNEW